MPASTVIPLLVGAMSAAMAAQGAPTSDGAGWADVIKIEYENRLRVWPPTT